MRTEAFFLLELLNWSSANLKALFINMWGQPERQRGTERWRESVSDPVIKLRFTIILFSYMSQITFIKH